MSAAARTPEEIDNAVRRLSSLLPGSSWTSALGGGYEGTWRDERAVLSIEYSGLLKAPKYYAFLQWDTVPSATVRYDLEIETPFSDTPWNALRLLLDRVPTIAVDIAASLNP